MNTNNDQNNNDVELISTALNTPIMNIITRELSIESIQNAINYVRDVVNANITPDMIKHRSNNSVLYIIEHVYENISNIVEKVIDQKTIERSKITTDNSINDDEETVIIGQISDEETILEVIQCICDIIVIIAKQNKYSEYDYNDKEELSILLTEFEHIQDDMNAIIVKLYKHKVKIDTILDIMYHIYNITDDIASNRYYFELITRINEIVNTIERGAFIHSILSTIENISYVTRAYSNCSVVIEDIIGYICVNINSIIMNMIQCDANPDMSLNIIQSVCSMLSTVNNMCRHECLNSCDTICDFTSAIDTFVGIYIQLIRECKQ